MNFYKILPAVVVLISFGCTDPTEHVTDVAHNNLQSFTLAAVNRPGIDGVFATIAREVPGFGGAFYDSNGDLNVYLKDHGQADAARASLERHLGSRIFNPIKQGFGPPRLVLLVGKLDWTELATLYDEAKRYLDVSDLVSTDIDERTQKIRIGVRTTQARQALLANLDKASFPVSNVDVFVQELPAPMELRSVEDRARPVIGGVRIQGRLNCTAGWNAVLEGHRILITNSHCTPGRGTVDTTSVLYQRQGGFLSTDRIGREYLDPPPFPCTINGFGTQSCRWSDAAAYLVDDSVTTLLGGFAYPEGENGTYYMSSEPLKIYDEVSALAGSYVKKIGATTGNTSGTVQYTCFDLGPYQPENIWYFCQSYATIRVRPGDSGAPVFVIDDGLRNSGRLAGLMWASDTLQNLGFYSAAWAVRNEFLGMVTH